MNQAVKPIPDDMRGVMPHLACDDSRAAIRYYEEVFGARQVALLAGPDGRVMHAMVIIRESVVMLHDAMAECGSPSPKSLKGTPVTLHLYVEDVDAVFAHAVKAGATAVMPPTEMFWGDRYGMLEDPFGHRWSIATHTRDLTPAQVEEGMKSFAADYPRGD